MNSFDTVRHPETSELLDLNYSEKYIDDILSALFKAQAENEKHVTYTFNKETPINIVDFTVKSIRAVFPNATLLLYRVKNLQNEILEICLSIDL